MASLVDTRSPEAGIDFTLLHSEAPHGMCSKHDPFCHFWPAHQKRGDAAASPFAHFLKSGGDQPTISLPAKNWAISMAAFSTLSEPWAEFSPTERANSLRMVPSAAFAGLVAPITSR